MFYFTREDTASRQSLERRLIGGLLPMQPYFQSNIPSNQWYIARIFQIWLAPIRYEELAGGFKPIRNSKIF